MFMSKFLGLLQMLAAIVLIIFASATLVNSILISARPETISVVNAIIGQGVVIVALLSFATICVRKSIKNLRRTEDP
ncbi:MAG: hypothetical protein CMQ41_04905 [Gammaproteobacteria bacterium]|nr:hypothetical protein [Gammaproteobacteria bacterium]